MGVINPRFVRSASVLLCCLALAASFSTGLGQALSETVLWWDIDDQNIEEPREREPNIVWDGVEDTVTRPVSRFFNPVRQVRRVGTIFGGDHVPSASDINALGEVFNSSWFTNRIGLFPMSVDEVVKGPGTGQGPDRSGKWTIVSAKTEGVTPGFNIKDARGNTYLIKFDPKGYLEMTTCAGVVCTKIFHAAGYNVPDDVTVRFRREDLVLGEGVRIKLKDGSRRPMTDADIDEILNSVDRLPSGEWFAISSKFLSGRPIGPFNYFGTRGDDPNDRIDHKHRRSLRGLEIFASWLNHFDTKQHNSLDMFVEEDGRKFVKHYLIDFASTLGSGAKGPQPRHGYEFTVDLPASMGRLFSLGAYETTWRRRSRPEGLPAVGYFDAKYYNPAGFKPLQPNTAFANRTGEDGYWAAKIITAFTDAQIDGIVESAGYTDPRSAEYIARILKARRNQIGKRFFDEIAPLEFFALESGEVRFRDLGHERGIYPRHLPLYRSRFAYCDSDRETTVWSDWIETGDCAVPLRQVPATQGRNLNLPQNDDDLPFLAFETQVRRAEGWSESVTAYLSTRSGRTVAMER